MWPPSLPEQAAREIDRAAEHPRVVQVILPLFTDKQWGDPFYRPIWEAAVRNGLVVTFHHSMATETLLGWPRYYIEWHTLAAPRTPRSHQVIEPRSVNGVFDKLPDAEGDCVLRGGRRLGAAG